MTASIAAKSGGQFVLLSLFCGAGGLDLGFERAGFQIGLAFDRKADSVASYNHNRRGQKPIAYCEDVRNLTLSQLDILHGHTFAPEGVIGGPPCQSFSQANRSIRENDERHSYPHVFCDILEELVLRNPIKFFVMENVPGLVSREHAWRLSGLVERLTSLGFKVTYRILDASHYQTPQKRQRLFIVGINEKIFGCHEWEAPPPSTKDFSAVTVRSAIGKLPEPTLYERGINLKTLPHHPNHWCMQPKSLKFTNPGLLVPGNANSRSFKTLRWDAPSITVAYGNREVHVHPGCHRRLSVFEAMLLQSFPRNYELLGSMSSQFAQVSEAVPPCLAEAVALSIKGLIASPGLLSASEGLPRRARRKQLSAISRAVPGQVATAKSSS